MKNWVTPKTVADLRSFLGFASYYRKFMKNFAKIATPLHAQVGNVSKREGKTALLNWTDECEEAFVRLKELITSTPVLAYPDFTKPFLVKTDACTKGLGAVLYQAQADGTVRPICYASRSLRPSESRYPAYKLEFLGLVWSVTRKFREYLYGGKFTVYTDSNPLTYIQDNAKLDAMTQRWVAELASFNVSIAYKPGATNVEADALSRIPWPDEPQDEDHLVLDEEIVQAAFSGATYASAYAFSMFLDSRVAVEPEDDAEVDGDHEQWLLRQAADPVLALVKVSWDSQSFGQAGTKKFQRATSESFRGGMPGRSGKSDGTTEEQRLYARLTETQRREYSQYLRHRRYITRRSGLLYRKKRSSLGWLWQLLLPKPFRKDALKGAHDKMGHLGRDRVLSVLEERVFWPGMRTDVERHIECCPRCLRFKSAPEIAPLQSVTASFPLEVVHLDFLKVEDSRDQYRSVLVVTDHFTGFAQAYLAPNESARSTAKLFVEEFCTSFGIPERIISDQGRNFESDLLKEVCGVLGVTKTRTTPYHPQTNGQCERFNKTLLSMLGTLGPKEKAQWSRQLKLLTSCYNATRHRITGFSPHFLLFGWNPRLPVDLELGLPLPGSWMIGKGRSRWAQRLRRQMRWATRVAQKARLKEAEKDKRRYDRRARGYRLALGDLCLVRVRKHQGKHKIADRWSEDVYVVTKVNGANSLVYVVEPRGGGVPLTLHRNLLLPLAGRVQLEVGPGPSSDGAEDKKANSKPEEKPVEPTQGADENASDSEGLDDDLSLDDPQSETESEPRGTKDHAPEPGLADRPKRKIRPPQRYGWQLTAELATLETRDAGIRTIVEPTVSGRTSHIGAMVIRTPCYGMRNTS